MPHRKQNIKVGTGRLTYINVSRPTQLLHRNRHRHVRTSKWYARSDGATAGCIYLLNGYYALRIDPTPLPPPPRTDALARPLTKTETDVKPSFVPVHHPRYIVTENSCVNRFCNRPSVRPSIHGGQASFPFA